MASLRITEVRTIVTRPSWNYVLVKIMTDEGIYGVGDASLAGRELAVAAALKEHLGPWLLGRDPQRIEDLWQSIFRGTYWRSGPVFMTALAGIDMALWDIKGKTAGMPVYQLLGGRTRDKVRVYMGLSGASLEAALENARKAVEKGFTALRFGPEGGYVGDRWDTARYLRYTPRLFKHLRENLGEEIDLCHDAHERCNPVQACRLAQDLEPYRLFFLEDPLRPEHKESFRLLRSHTSIPLAMGELFYDIWDCLPLVREQLIDYIRVDLCHFGGITQARKLAAICEPYYVETVFHGPPDISPITHAANVHLDLSIPNFGLQEFHFHTPETYEVITGGPEYKDGYLTIPERPGLGVDIDEEAAERHRGFKPFYAPTLRRTDGSLTDW
ncbi:MAG: galactonate dehydratase [Candidatus Bathyarchaeia archaeon]